jgi:4-methyl-5(b-hydroxyethyl)-thiazole monophosphate biosynthesis
MFSQWKAGFTNCQGTILYLWMLFFPMQKKALIVLSNGFEDIEGVAIIDVLTRCGVAVTIAGLEKGPINAAYGTTIIPHISVDEVEGDFDAILFPGGKRNAVNLSQHPKVLDLIKKYNKANKLIGAICAAPSHVLAEGADILRGKLATGDPVFNDKLLAGGAIITDMAVTADGNIITGMGPGAALEFALKLAEYLVGPEIPMSFRGKWRLNS